MANQIATLALSRMSRAWIITGLAVLLATAPNVSQTAPQTAEAATKAAIERIRAIDPQIHAVIALDPTALDQAKAIDQQPGKRGLLYGYAILLKDNIEADGPLPTTAGSWPS